MSKPASMACDACGQHTSRLIFQAEGSRLLCVNCREKRDVKPICAACGKPSVRLISHAGGSHLLCTHCEPEDITPPRLCVCGMPLRPDYTRECICAAAKRKPEPQPGPPKRQLPPLAQGLAKAAVAAPEKFKLPPLARKK